MDAQLLAFGLGAFALGIGFLVAGRRLYPRLEVPPEARRSLQLLTALIAAILMLTGLGLVLIGIVSSAGVSAGIGTWPSPWLQ